MDYDVIEVGAGPAGATAARDLARQGLSVGLFEQHRRNRRGRASAARPRRPAEVVAVDLSRGMLHAGRKKIADRRVRWERQDITALPYPDRSFDVVVSTWALETLPDPAAAAREFLRVTRDDGFVIYAFSSRPPAGLDRLYAQMLEDWSAGALQGRFLARVDQPYHACVPSRLVTFGHRLATVILLRKCCRVDDPEEACLPRVLAG